MLDFNLRTQLGIFAGAMALRAQEKGLELILDVTGIKHSMVVGDPSRIRQVLTNLVGNAIKFTESGEVVIRTELKDEGDNNLTFHASIIDTGIGIPADKIDNLFESFTQVDASTTRQFGGTGLGLAIVKKLVELMQGSIHVSSESGQGSQFEFSIPLQLSTQSQQVIPQVDIAALKLLVVDDNATNREVLRGQLESWGAKVVLADSGAVALALCQQCLDEGRALFDVAFLDMQMPFMDGAQLGQVLRKNNSFDNMKMIMMTSMSQRGDAQYFADLGFVAYFPKPVTTSDLFDALAVVADDGEALRTAQPLLTQHYVKSLNRHDSVDRQSAWPADVRILLVEDNNINQEVALGMLKEIGLTADTANDGKEALAALNNTLVDSPYTLILMDCQMPIMDGYSTAKAIRAGQGGQYYCDITMLALTANAMSGDKQKCLDAGMNDYLSKPINPDDLVIILEKWLCVHDISVINPDAPLLDRRLQEEHVPEADQVIEANTELEIWDEQAALKRMSGKPKTLVRIAELYLNTVPAEFAAVKAAMEADDRSGLHELAHKIKGIAGHLSAMQLCHIAQRLEVMATAQQTNSIELKSLCTQLQDAHELVCIRIQSFLKLQKVDVPASLDVLSTEALLVLLQQLLKNLQHGDYIDELQLQQLKQGHSDVAVVALLDQLCHQISVFDFEKAEQTVNKLYAHFGETNVLGKD